MVAPSQHLIRETASHRDEQRPLHISVLATISAAPAPIYLFLYCSLNRHQLSVKKYYLHIKCLNSDQSLIRSCRVTPSAIYPATPLPASSATAKSLNPMIFVHGNYILVEYFTKKYQSRVELSLFFVASFSSLNKIRHRRRLFSREHKREA